MLVDGVYFPKIQLKNTMSCLSMILLVYANSIQRAFFKKGGKRGCGRGESDFIFSSLDENNTGVWCGDTCNTFQWVVLLSLIHI